MSNVDRWLLPDGIDEVLPEQARLVEKMRRDIIDLYDNWGYDLVIPPMVEYTESLLSGHSIVIRYIQPLEGLQGHNPSCHRDL